MKCGGKFREKIGRRQKVESARQGGLRSPIGRFAASVIFRLNDPGVSLRSTPGFMPTSALRTEDFLYPPLRASALLNVEINF
jgi:hypothetical protein